ncbi:uncharacterized protein LOC127570088 isoform X2 [Pristis pectinata]|nr:uncharacterized protein LOC127570088 isoform X2 [Pristis pectinata]
MTFHRTSAGNWSRHGNRHYVNLYVLQEIRGNPKTINLRIRDPIFKLAGSFTLIQTQPRKHILQQHEIFGIKTEASPQRSVVGSDVTLSCTISRLPDTVSLQWEPKDSSQQNRRDIDQIRLNNTVYLMVRHVTVEDGKLYACQVRENGNIVLTSKADFVVTNDLYQQSYTLYRSGTDHSELHLICFHKYKVFYFNAAWTWRSHHLQEQEKEVASVTSSQSISVNRADFGNRLVTSVERFNGKDFSVRIVPVLFEDAGDYSCSLGSNLYLNITLITVKVTAEPPDAVTEGDNVTLTCSVSEITDSMRLVWINGDGKTVGEKIFNEQSQEEKSFQLIIPKADGVRRKWTCCLLHENTPRFFIPHFLKTNMRTFPDIWIIALSGYLLVKLAVALGLICYSLGMNRGRIFMKCQVNQKGDTGIDTVVVRSTDMNC